MNSTSTDTSNSNSSVMSGGDFGLGRLASVTSAMNQPDQNLQIASWLITDMLNNVTKACEESRLPSCKDDNNNMNLTIDDGDSNNAYVELSIFNLNGLLVETLVEQVMDKGFHNIKWNADSEGSGIYFYTLESEGYVDSRKIVLIK